MDGLRLPARLRPVPVGGAPTPLPLYPAIVRHLLHDDPAYAEAAKDFAERVKDVSHVLEGMTERMKAEHVVDFLYERLTAEQR
ncbi:MULTISPECIES: hypothetical protein [Paenibacillus]|uniref:hypothetical protein n=1 Tax=Paenibacillus TaxID=44249 RepID=UPI001142BD3B|nr:hypothetical protein [Paenibacillus sp. tmac-D7]